MSQEIAVSPDARHAAQATDLLVTVATSLNERLAVTALELARSQALLREASDELADAMAGEDTFDFGLDRIVDGLEARLARHA